MPRRRLLMLTGYVAFALFALVMSLYLTFPADAVAQRLAREVQRHSAGVWSMTYGAASPYRFSGLALQEVTFKRNQGAGDPLSLTFDALRARLRLLPLLLFRVSVDAQLVTGDGLLAARVTPHGAEAVDATLEADAFNLGSPPILSRLAGLPITGTLSGSVDASWQRDLTKATALADLQLGDTRVGPGTVAGFTLPQIDLGSMSLGVDVKDGKLKVSPFKQKGGNLNLQLKGNLQLREPIMASPVDLCVQVRADPTFLNSNPKMRTVLQLAEVSLKKDGEGYLHLPLQGPLNAPHLTGGLCR